MHAEGASAAHVRKLRPHSSNDVQWVSGDRAVTVRDERGNAVAMPTQPWPRPRANALLEARGVYRLANGNAGLIMQVTAMQIAEGGRNGVDDPFQIKFPLEPSWLQGKTKKTRPAG